MVEKLLRENAQQHSKIHQLEMNLKQTHIKMREFLQKNHLNMSDTAYEEIEKIIVPSLGPTQKAPRPHHEIYIESKRAGF